jgi:outer membrane protein TolC
MTKKKVLLVVLAVLAVSRGFSQALSLEDVRELALGNSRSLKKYDLQLQSSLLDEKAQNFQYLPSLSLDAQASANLWNTDGPTLPDSIKAGASVGISETVTIYDGGKNKMLKAINALSTESVRKDALAEYYNVLNSADNAYYAVMEAKDSLAAAEISLKTAELGLSAAQVRYDNKMIRYGDYLQALSEKESAEVSKKKAERTLNLNMLKLKNLLGIKDTPVLAEVDFTAYEAIIQKCASFDEDALDALYASFWKAVEANNPDLAKAVLAGRRAEQNVDLAKKDFLPSVSAGLSTGLSYNYQYGGLNNKLSPFVGSLSLKVSVPLDFWVINNKIEKQKNALEQNKLTYQDSVASVEIEVQTSLLDLVNQAGTVAVSRRAYEYAQKQFEYVRELYELSQKSLSDFSDASKVELQSRNQFINSRYGFLQALSRLKGLGAFADEPSLIALIMR